MDGDGERRLQHHHARRRQEAVGLEGQAALLLVKDQKPGDKTGDGFNNVWHVAKP
jgi:predicted lipoprotein with Yx(FWY)xxD motif